MNTSINTIMQQFKDKHILVLGDFMLDIYIDGHCNRLAPEASVPVLDVQEQTVCLGGAANSVLNLSKLDAHVHYVTILGQDESAKTAIDLLRKQSLESLCIHFTELSPTISKTRLRMDGQYIYRFDLDKRIEISEPVLKDYLRDIRKVYHKVDAVLISDYGKGSMPYQVIELLAELQEKDNKVFAVDSKNYEWYKALHPHLIKPNYQEALQMVGEVSTPDRITHAMQWADTICNLSYAKTIAISLDKDGVVLCKGKENVSHYPAQQISITNTSGAGDTMLSTLLLAYICGASDYEAVKLAMTAANISIQKPQTAHCTFAELRVGLIDQQDKVIDNTTDAAYLAEALRQDKKIVLTNGCFDILHSGHTQYLQQAKQMGDILIVGVNTDESVRRLKGEYRPVNTFQDRIEVLKQLNCVDYIIPFGHEGNDTPINLIQAIRPHLFVKGEDYTHATLPEAEVLSKLGIDIRFVTHIPHQSTTKIIERVQQKHLVVLKKSG